MDAFVGPVASSKPPVLQGTNGRLKEREVRAINRTIYQPVRQTARRGVPGGLRTFSLHTQPPSSWEPAAAAVPRLLTMTVSTP